MHRRPQQACLFAIIQAITLDIKTVQGTSYGAGKGIASLVEAFIAAGRPSSRDQHIDDRRAGYIASAVLAGETETRVRVEDITTEGMHFRVVSPPTADGLLPTLIYYHGGCFVSGGFTTHDNQLRQLAMFSGCRVIAVQYRGAGAYLSGGAR